MEIISGLGEEAATLGRGGIKKAKRERGFFSLLLSRRKGFFRVDADVIKTFALMRHRISRAWAGAGLAGGSPEFVFCNGIS